VTLFLIGVCLVVAAITKLGDDQRPIEPYLFMTNLSQPSGISSQEVFERFMQEQSATDGSQHWRGLSEIRHGQVWRLFAPIFIHRDVLHLLFNMWMLFVLGGILEERYGSGWFLFLVLVSALISNLSQYFWTGPSFGGMSGVNYALFGYAWMKSTFDLSAGFRLQESTIFLMLLWLVVCFTGWNGQIANAAHVAGLIVGMIFGYAPVLLRR
jgi:GlpG protein